MTTGQGTELLIVDPHEKGAAGLRAHFEREGYVVTLLSTSEDAQRSLTRKYFPIALIELDVDGPDRGLLLVHAVRQTSPATGVVLLTRRPSFEGAVAAMRAGVLDVVHVTGGELPHLTAVVAKARARSEAEQDGAIFRETRAVLDQALKVMIGQSHTVYAHLSQAVAPLRPRILIVDGEQDFLRELSQLVRGRDWEIAGEMSGGGALDKGLGAPFDVVAVRDELPDLRGTMVIRTIQAQKGEVAGVVYSAANGGRVDRVEQGQVEHTDRPFRGAAHLIETIQRIADALGARAQERRIIQAFSADHRDLLRRYAELKLKIDRLLAE